MSMALQIVSYLDGIEKLVLFQEENISSAIKIISDLKDSDAGLQKGLTLGGFLMSSARASEEKVLVALEQIKKTLEPLEIRYQPVLDNKVNFFSVDLDKDLADSLKESKRLLKIRGQAINQLKKDLLEIDEEVIKSLYPKEVISSYESTWQEGFDHI
jgi:hypothetical protein